MTAVILQSNYIPWKGYFDLLHDADVFIFHDELQYTKQDWRNRNKIYTKKGLEWLTIPVGKKAEKMLISQVELSDTSWQKEHHKSLYWGYKTAPFFDQLEPIIKDIYVDKKWDTLVALNHYWIDVINDMLGIKTKIIHSKDLILEDGRVNRLITMLQQVGASAYISGPAAQDYIKGNEHQFSDNGITLLYKNYPQYKTYQQLHDPFENAVSVVDLIANIGKTQIPEYIWKTQSI